MSKGLAFYILLLIWLIFGLYGFFRPAPSSGPPYGPYRIAGDVLLFILFLLLGWALFGPPLQ